MQGRGASQEDGVPGGGDGSHGPPVVVLTGPTSVGKTAVALELARLLPLRIISCDSMQVYRRMDIGTAKPTPAEQQSVRHYGIDLVDPDQPFSVAEYLAAVLPAIRETQQAGEMPLVVGGTRLYLQALAGSYDSGPPPDPVYRAKLAEEAAASGVPALHERLALVDPDSARRIHPNDLKRIVRALEVYQSGGMTISRIQQESRARSPLVEALKIALVRDRADLYRTVEARTTKMIETGWLEEVRDLVKDGYGPSFTAIMAHGYRELAAHLRGEVDLPGAIGAINRNVRHYVRYQSGWIRQLPDVHIFPAEQPPPVLAVQIRDLIAARASWLPP